MAYRFPSTLRRAKSRVLALTTVWLSLAALTMPTPVTKAAPLSSGSPPTVLPPVAPGARGWGGMPMGSRSADGRFIVMMIPHHEGAIAMADLALQRSRRPEIRALAERIRSS